MNLILFEPSYLTTSLKESNAYFWYSWSRSCIRSLNQYSSSELTVHFLWQGQCEMWRLVCNFTKVSSMWEYCRLWLVQQTCIEVCLPSMFKTLEECIRHYPQTWTNTMWVYFHEDMVVMTNTAKLLPSFTCTWTTHDNSIMMHGFLLLIYDHLSFPQLIAIVEGHSIQRSFKDHVSLSKAWVSKRMKSEENIASCELMIKASSIVLQSDLLTFLLW